MSRTPTSAAFQALDVGERGEGGHIYTTTAWSCICGDSPKLGYWCMRVDAQKVAVAHHQCRCMPTQLAPQKARVLVHVVVLWACFRAVREERCACVRCACTRIHMHARMNTHTRARTNAQIPTQRKFLKSKATVL